MSGKGLTANNCSIILDGVLVVVHVGVTTLVKELLVAAVMGMAAPRGGERRAGCRARLGPSPAVRDTDRPFHFLTGQTFKLGPREGQLLA